MVRAGSGHGGPGFAIDAWTAPHAGILAPMTRWAVFAGVRAQQPMAESVAVDAFQGFQPDDEDLCIWRDQSDTTLLNVTTEVDADEMEDALAAGVHLAREILAFIDFDARLEGIEAEPVE